MIDDQEIDFAAPASEGAAQVPDEALECDEPEECDRLRERMSDLLRRTAVALRGEPPPLTLWSWHDLPERAAAAVAALDVMTRAAQLAAAPKEGSPEPQAAQPVAWSDALAERQRQIEAEGWTAEHDDEHDAGTLAAASSAYALAAADALNPLSQGDGRFAVKSPPSWPFDDDWWKPGPPRRMLVKAVALGLAEIERLDRAEVKRQAWLNRPLCSNCDEREACRVEGCRNV